MSNSQLNKLKSAIKNGTGVTLKLSSSLIGSSNDETNFSHKLLSTDTLVQKFVKLLLADCRQNKIFKNPIV